MLQNSKDGISVLKGKNIVIVGCGAQGLNQGLNMRDSGLRYFLCTSTRRNCMKKELPILTQQVIISR